MLVAIEGIDASGKQTLTKSLVEHYHMSSSMSFPAYDTDVGALIRSSLATTDGYTDKKAQALMLQALMTINRYEFINVLEAAKRIGEKLFLDRYWYSGLVYGHVDGLNISWLLRVQSKLPRADATIFLDITVDESLRRRPVREDRYEADTSFMDKVRKTYLDLCDLADQPFICINGCQEPNLVLLDAIRAIDRLA